MTEHSSRRVDATLPGEPVDLTELRRVAADGTALRYALMELAAQTPDVIALGRGDPDMDTPEHVIAAAQEAVTQRPGRSARTAGRAACAAHRDCRKAATRQRHSGQR